jgi:hypothetical protein
MKPINPEVAGEVMSEALDKAWERINALGDFPFRNDYELGYGHAIEHVLLIIEELGGSDPAPRHKAAGTQP